MPYRTHTLSSWKQFIENIDPKHSNKINTLFKDPAIGTNIFSFLGIGGLDFLKATQTSLLLNAYRNQTLYGYTDLITKQTLVLKDAAFVAPAFPSFPNGKMQQLVHVNACDKYISAVYNAQVNIYDTKNGSLIKEIIHVKRPYFYATSSFASTFNNDLTHLVLLDSPSWEEDNASLYGLMYPPRWRDKKEEGEKDLVTLIEINTHLVFTLDLPIHGRQAHKSISFNHDGSQIVCSEDNHLYLIAFVDSALQLMRAFQLNTPIFFASFNADSTEFIFLINYAVIRYDISQSSIKHFIKTNYKFDAGATITADKRYVYFSYGGFNFFEQNRQYAKIDLETQKQLVFEHVESGFNASIQNNHSAINIYSEKFGVYSFQTNTVTWVKANGILEKVDQLLALNNNFLATDKTTLVRYRIFDCLYERSLVDLPPTHFRTAVKSIIKKTETLNDILSQLKTLIEKIRVHEYFKTTLLGENILEEFLKQYDEAMASLPIPPFSFETYIIVIQTLNSAIQIGRNFLKQCQNELSFPFDERGGYFSNVVLTESRYVMNNEPRFALLDEQTQQTFYRYESRVIYLVFETKFITFDALCDLDAGKRKILFSYAKNYVRLLEKNNFITKSELLKLSAEQLNWLGVYDFIFRDFFQSRWIQSVPYFFELSSEVRALFSVHSDELFHLKKNNVSFDFLVTLEREVLKNLLEQIRLDRSSMNINRVMEGVRRDKVEKEEDGAFGEIKLQFMQTLFRPRQGEDTRVYPQGGCCGLFK